MLCNLKQKKPSFPLKQVVYRDVKSINIDSLKSDLNSLKLCSDPPEGHEQLVEYYKTTLAGIFNTHAPLKSKMITVRTRLPWFDQEIKSAIRLRRRRAERKWRRTDKGL